MNLQTVRESLDACDYAVVLWADERLAPLVAGSFTRTAYTAWSMVRTGRT